MLGDSNGVYAVASCRLSDSAVVSTVDGEHRSETAAGETFRTAGGGVKEAASLGSSGDFSSLGGVLRFDRGVVLECVRPGENP